VGHARFANTRLTQYRQQAGTELALLQQLLKQLPALAAAKKRKFGIISEGVRGQAVVLEVVSR
jgi:hypothetical protein